MLLHAIIKAFQEKYQRGWDTLYFAVDLHGTIIERYTGENINSYGGAEEVLRSLSSMPDVVLILFTSTSAESLQPFYKWCSERGIHFKYLNENPECDKGKLGDFSKKFYYNILLDDRAGFNPYSDWQDLPKCISLARVMTACPHVETCRRGLKYSGNSSLCTVCAGNAYLFKELPE
jgi:hypothetical protein